MTRANELEAIKKQYRYLRFMCQETLDHVSFVNSRVKDIEGFWLSTLVRTYPDEMEMELMYQLKHTDLKNIISSKSDKDALKYLTQIELVQDVKDPRPFSLKFVCPHVPLKRGADDSTSKRTHTSLTLFLRRSTLSQKESKPPLRMEALLRT